MQGMRLVRRGLLLPMALTLLGFTAARASAQNSVYAPIEMPETREINDVLTEEDFFFNVAATAEIYTVYLEDGDQVAIDVISEEFDTLVTLINKDGNTISENDDGPDGTTNSLLFARITESGMYTVRVRSYAGQGTGDFYLKVARLREIK